MKRAFPSTVCLLLASLAVPALAWGPKGHTLSARLATRALPADMPAFFREASERLAYQCPEPDRWRGPNQPALTAATAPDHGMRLELLRGIELPATRYEFIVLRAVKRIETRDYEFSKMVTVVGDRRNGDGGRYWTYLVNGKLATQAADRYITSDGERIEWRFTRH